MRFFVIVYLILPFISISQDNSIKSSKEHNIEIKDLINLL